jgi:hypothetical protein
MLAYSCDARLIRKAIAVEDCRDRLVKAWSDKAREAAAEARRHRALAFQHYRTSMRTRNDERALQDSHAAAAHEAAAEAHEDAEGHYNQSKITTLMDAASQLSDQHPMVVLAGTAGALAERAARQRHKARRARRLSEAADAMSADLA